jgi:hypothetical protein
MCWTEPAVAARTAVHTAASVRVGVGGRATTTALGHAVDADGDLLVAVSQRQVSVLAMFVTAQPGELVPGTAIATDLAPVAVADRVRRTVTLHGPLVTLTDAARSDAERLVRAREARCDPLIWDGAARILRLEPTSITTYERCMCVGSPSDDGVEQKVPVGDYLAAQPDPLIDVEADWLCHLAADHESALTLLAMHAAPWLDEATLQVSPLAVDRSGLRLRTRTSHGCRDLHLAFDSPAECACEANHAINDLFVRASAVP